MKPLPLTAEMALAAILGPKTETRRPMRLGKGSAALEFDRRCKAIGVREALDEFGHYGPHLPAPFGPVGTRLWLREPGRVVDIRCVEEDEPFLTIEYPADKAQRAIRLPERFGIDNLGNWPSWCKIPHGIPNGIFREAARFKTVVLEVRVERLWEITEAGAIAEGVEAFGGGWPGDNATWRDYQLHTLNGLPSARESFLGLWNSIYGKRPGLAWADNPWVSVTAWDRMVAI